jgi:hypothetical protein
MHQWNSASISIPWKISGEKPQATVLCVSQSATSLPCSDSRLSTALWAFLETDGPLMKYYQFHLCSWSTPELQK